MSTSTTLQKQRRVIFWVICAVYFFVYFHRVSTSVIVADLLAAFHTDATTLGVLSSMYFYLYAAEQPLVGFLTDRLGARRVIGCWTLMAAIGSFLFGLAPNIAWAAIGRALIGLGVGGVYVPALQTMAIRFPQNQFAALMGIFMSVGNLGAIVATSPLAWMAVHWGWRPAFLGIGVLTLVLAVVTLTVTRDHSSAVQTPMRTDAPPGRKNATGLRSDLAGVLRSGQFWIIGMILFGVYGTFVTLQGLWATPFLMVALGIDRAVASELNMAIPIGVIIGAPLLGWLADRFGLDKRRSVIAGTAISALLWAMIIFGNAVLGKAGLALTLALLGLVIGGFLTLAWGIVRERTPPAIMGLTSGLMNPLPMLGAAFFQVMTGAILDKGPKVGDVYGMQGFVLALGVCMAANLICIGLAFGIHKK